MKPTGLYVPLITPFAADGAIAVEALEGLAVEILDAGASGLIALGTTGEPASLTDIEKQTVVDVIARACRDRNSQFIIGANTPEAVRALASRDDVAAAMSLVPPFIRPGEAGVVAYFEHLAAAGVPLIVYDVPHRTAQYLSADTLRRLAEIPGVVGVKYAPGHINTDTVSLLADPPAGMAILGGDDVFISPLLAMGAVGGIMASAHLATADFVRLIDRWGAGDLATARPLGERLSSVSAALFAEPNPTVIKAVLHAQGKIPTPHVRLPLLQANPATVDAALGRLAESSAETAQREGREA